MQLLCLVATDELVPLDISQLAQIIFQPVQNAVFHNIWRQCADLQTAKNLQLDQQDPRYGVGTEAHMGLGQHSNAQAQARWHPLVLEQVKAIGIEAIMRTAELSEPKP